MTWSFTLSYEGKTHELTATRVAVDATSETWRVYSSKNQNSFIVLTNDKPLLDSKRQYADWFTWTVLEGEPRYRKMVKQITTYLEYQIKGTWRPPKKGKPEAKPITESPQGRLF